MQEFVQYFKLFLVYRVVIVDFLSYLVDLHDDPIQPLIDFVADSLLLRQDMLKYVQQVDPKRYFWSLLIHSSQLLEQYQLITILIDQQKRLRQCEITAADDSNQTGIDFLGPFFSVRCCLDIHDYI